MRKAVSHVRDRMSELDAATATPTARPRQNTDVLPAHAGAEAPGSGQAEQGRARTC